MPNKISHRYAIPLLMACVLLVAPWSARAATVAAQDNPRASKVCLDCHEGQDATLASTAHWSASDVHDGPEARIACTDCHSGDHRHWEGEPETYPMTNPSKVSAIAEPDLSGLPLRATWFLYSGLRRSANDFGGFLTRVPL